jgi:hypothetical protein
MLSLFKRFGWVAPASHPVIVPGDGKAPYTKAHFLQVKQIMENDIEGASTEWAEALSALTLARENFNNADAEYFDTAVVALNLAHMRVDNAQNRLRKLMGVEKAAVGV